MSYNNPTDNPWDDAPAQAGRNHQNQGAYQAYQGQPQSTNPYTQPQSYSQQEPHSEVSPWSQEQGHAPPHAHPHAPFSQQQHDAPSYGQEHHRPYQQQQQQQQHSSAQEEVPPGLPPRRTATDMALPTGQDRSHQIEVMQSYEAAGRKDEDDSNVEILQREFPRIDGSLIAAIYGDSKSLSATREMLQALE